MPPAETAARQAPRCPDENTLGAFVEGQLDDRDARALEDHVDGCAGCYELMAAYGGARAEPRASSGETTGDATRVTALQRARPLAPGSTVGRYVVLGWIGEGGAGVVYAAYDPELDRKIAIKLLHPRTDEDPFRTTLLREARAMAKLAHPDVVVVHDVGLHDGRVFVAMEFVAGKTLRAWREERRSVREILAAYVAAGRGLAAAHSVGLVHRDFKPENVLVGEDGRARVTDFGLALGGAEAPANPRAGTPAYMAPEQRRGEAVDARTDQYAFAVALEEALFRNPEPPAGRVPARLRRILARAASESPGDRYPSMDALLAEVEADPAQRWRRALLWAAAIVTTGSVAFAALGRTRAAPAPACTGGERMLAGVWDGARQADISRAFAATGKPYAADAWRGAQSTLDGYARAWVATRTDVCEATHVRGEQSSELLDTRMACLDDRLKELRALSDVFARADADVVTNALAASESLGRAASCKDVRLLAQARAALDPAKATAARALRGQLAELKALHDAGKYDEAIPQAARVADAATATGVRALEGEALFRYGELRGRAGDLEGAGSTLERAALAADAAGDDRTRARAYSALLFFVASEQAKFDRIGAFRDHASAAIDRLGGDDELRADLDHSLGAALSSQGALDQAQRTEEEALALVEKVYGTASREAAFAMNNLGLTCLFRGDTDRALDLFRRSLATAEAALGPHHPQIGNMHNNLGLAFSEKADRAGAEAAFRRALAVYEGALGPDHPRVASALEGIGGEMVDRGDFDAAIPLLKRALTIREERLRPDHPSLFYTHRALGQAYLGRKDARAAIAHLERAVVLREGAGESDVADAEFSLAEAMLLAGRAPAAARALAVRARDSLAAHASGTHENARLAAMNAWLAAPPGK